MSRNSDCDSPKRVFDAIDKEGQGAKKKRRKDNSRIEELECWAMYVNFSQCHLFPSGAHSWNEMDSSWNPYTSRIEHVSMYIYCLKEILGLHNREIIYQMRVLTKYLPYLDIHSIESNGLLENIAPDTIVKSKHFEICFKKSAKGWHSCLKLERWKLFQSYCLENSSVMTSPFLVDRNTIVDFLCFMLKMLEQQKISSEILKQVKRSPNFYETNITDALMHLSQYLKVGFFENFITGELLEIIDLGKYLDRRIPIPNYNRAYDGIVSDYDFTQNSINTSREKFWEQRLVQNVLTDVQNESLEINKAAWHFGVTETMLINVIRSRKKIKHEFDCY